MGDPAGNHHPGGQGGHCGVQGRQRSARGRFPRRGGPEGHLAPGAGPRPLSPQPLWLPHRSHRRHQHSHRLRRRGHGPVRAPGADGGGGGRVRRPRRQGRAQGRAAARALLRQPQGAACGRTGDRRESGVADRGEGRGGHHQGADRHPERRYGTALAAHARRAEGEAHGLCGPAQQRAGEVRPEPPRLPPRPRGCATCARRTPPLH